MEFLLVNAGANGNDVEGGKWLEQSLVDVVWFRLVVVVGEDDHHVRNARPIARRRTQTELRDIVECPAVLVRSVARLS